jgi:hypothetical protein
MPPRLSFSLRDVFWLTLVIGLGCAWGIARIDAQKAQRNADAAQREARGWRMNFEEASRDVAVWEERYRPDPPGTAQRPAKRTP